MTTAIKWRMFALFGRGCATVRMMRQENFGCMGDFANGRPGVVSKLFLPFLFGARGMFCDHPRPTLSGVSGVALKH
jgi:hypothetical protein